LQKKKPERTCIICKTQKEKKELLRIVKSKDGIIEPDITGKKNGRGAYICKNENCLNKLIKTKKLEQIFEKEISKEVYENIKSIINNFD